MSKKVFIRADWLKDNNNSDPLASGEPIDVYTIETLEEAVIPELQDRGGGYVHDESGKVFMYVAPQ